MATRNRGLSNYAAQAIRWAPSLAQKSSRTVLWIATASIIFLLFLINFRGSTHYVPESCGSAPDFDSPWTPLGGNTNAPQLSDLVVQRKNSHGEMIKVLFVVISSSVSPVVCRNVASAFLSGVPVAVVSNGKQPFRYEHKLNFTLRASEEAGLGEKDVVVYMDSDTMFTGMNPFHFIDRFINLSPESPDKMHVGAIRNSTTMSPMIFSSESLCSSWTTFGLGKTCEDMFESIRGLVGTYYAERIKDRFGYVYDVNRYNKTLYPTQYLNSGTVVARIWAAKEMNKAIRRAVDVRINGSRKPESVSIDDQSFIHYVYHDLLLTELHFNSVLENRGVSQFGLHAGLLDVDIHQEISTLPWGGTGLVELNLRSWSGSWTHVMQRKGDDPYAPEDPNGDFVSRCPFHESIAKFLRPVLQSTGPQITRREYTVGGTVLASILAPPLFSRSEQKDIGYVYPFIRHYPSTNKILRMDSEAPFMAWGVPVLFDAAARRNANTLLRSLRIVIHSAGEDVAVHTHQYTDVCPFPFASWGLQEIY